MGPAAVLSARGRAARHQRARRCRARPERGAEPRLGPVPLRVRGRRVGAGGLAAAAERTRRSRVPAAATGARAACRETRGHRPRAGRRDDRPGGAPPRVLRLGRAGRADAAARARDRRRSRESASARARRSRRRVAVGARGQADDRVPDRGLPVPLGRDARRSARRSRSRAGAVAFVTAGRPRGRDHGWGMRIELYPGASRQFVGHADFHGAWLDYSF